LLHLPNGHTADEVQKEVVRKMKKLPEQLRKTLAWDQGSELALHGKISRELDMQVFFCDPHSPWQRGTNENTNGLLRQYFPKGADLSVYSEKDLDKAAKSLNNRPRMTLGWKTPAQKFLEFQESCISKSK
jgi:IS30 family transposase